VPCCGNWLLEVDHALKLIQIAKPVLKREETVLLRAISGLGTKKLEAYGENVLAVVAEG